MAAAEEQVTIRVVLAEDHHVMRAALHLWLSREPDFEVVGEVADGGALLSVVQEKRPDVLVMDARMPNHDPVRSAEAVRECCPDVKIVVLSAHSTSEYVVGLLKAGVRGYVLKDDARDALMLALREVAGGGEWVSPRVAGILINSVTGSGGDSVARLTDRENEVLVLMARGYRNERIAEELVISEHTVRNHIHNIFHKLDVGTRVEAVLYAISANLVSLEDIRDSAARWPPSGEEQRDK
ncbi:MAG TPA: response regulator transcription factor [Candidatus Sulfomarinibacteraceae bacterium]|nr:response regulator transcription factor [Candidatus Sulfomarinibacteraceae bacterium]